MELIPVMDLMSGIAVSGKSGERDTYQPLKTVYSKTPDPVDIAISLKRKGFKRIYVADLDAIEGRGSNLEIVQKINHVLPVTLDWGVRDIKSFSFALDFADKIIIATETLTSWDDLEEIYTQFPRQRIVISIDVKDGQILSRDLSISFTGIKSKLEEFKSEEIILLDISGVGTLSGFKLDLLNNFRGMEDSLILGGGITPDDIQNLNKLGFKRYLIGTALHTGKIQ